MESFMLYNRTVHYSNSINNVVTEYCKTTLVACVTKVERKHGISLKLFGYKLYR